MKRPILKLNSLNNICLLNKGNFKSLKKCISDKKGKVLKSSSFINFVKKNLWITPTHTLELCYLNSCCYLRCLLLKLQYRLDKNVDVISSLIIIDCVFIFANQFQSLFYIEENNPKFKTSCQWRTRHYFIMHCQ